MDNFETPREAKIDRFFQKSGAKDVFSTELKAFEYMDNLNYEDFKSHLTRINGIVLNLPKSERGTTSHNIEFGSPTYGNVEFLPPNPQDKDGLLEDIFNACKSLDSPKDAALLAYLGIQTIHPFADGNGRTGRSIFNLMVGSTPFAQDRESFSRQNVRPPGEVNALLCRELMKDIFGAEFVAEYGNISSSLSAAFQQIDNPDIPKDLRTEASKVISEKSRIYIPNQISFRDLVILRFLQTQRSLSLDESPHKPFPYDMTVQYGEDKGKKIFCIDGEALIQSLSEDDCRNLVELHAQMKKQLIQKLIDVVIKPDQYTRDEKPLKDQFFAES